MSYGPSDVVDDVQRLLIQEGYRFPCPPGEEVETAIDCWTLGNFCSIEIHGPIDTGFNGVVSHALEDYVGQVRKLKVAATRVIDNWETHNLAQSVRELQEALDAIQP